MIIWREKHTFCQEQNSRSQSFAAFKSNLLIEKVTFSIIRAELLQRSKQITVNSTEKATGLSIGHFH